MVDVEKVLEASKKKCFDSSYNMRTAIVRNDGSFKWSENYMCMGGWGHKDPMVYRDSYAFVVRARSKQYWDAQLREDRNKKWAKYVKEGWIKTYYDYLTQESAWSAPHIIKDYDQAVGRAFLVSTDYDANLAYGACVATRFPYEYRDYFVAWCMFVERGCNKDLAFRMAHMLYWDSNLEAIAKGSAGHSSVHSTNTCPNIRGFVNHERKYEELSFKEGGSISGINNMWKGDGKGDDFLINLKYVPPGKDYYIFRCASRKNRDSVFIGEEGVNFLIEQFTNKYVR